MSANVKSENLKKVLSHGPTRLIFFGGIALMLMVVVVAFSLLGRSKPQGDGSAELTNVPVPVESNGSQPMNTQAYDQLASASDAEAAEQAKRSGESAMPMPRVGQAEPEVKPDVAAGMPPAQGSAATATATEPTGPSEAEKQAQAAQQLQDQAVAARYQIMAKQYDQLVARWPGGGAVREPMTIRAPVVQATAAAAASADALPTAEVTADVTSPDIRANEAFLGVTISQANTDDPLPLVRARVLNGPAKGAVLLGTIETSERAPGGLVRFNLMTLPGAGNSVAIDAVAIDPATSRSTVASSVNRHTVSRMAALFFSSVLGGVSEAMLKGGQQERVVVNGATTVVQRDAYSDRDLALIGVGKVGVNSAQMMESAVNRRPTVVLKSGIDIGVLFLKDLTLP